MYLKRLEIFGFKSFADKTELEFTPGITAVVGPNGSGKSNVSDAVRWVLGEQSAKALRGGNMADVIFAGSASKKAMGFAQVSLVLDNSDGLMGVGFTEVMVTRRVDRSGEGEYFINQVPCRLKDVQDLFMDTGIGKENYSIIGQGKIDEILSTKPEDRRALFEEAAGISRYKSRKREAQRRLEETEQNLLRITDIVGELNGQMESLADQATRAGAFNELSTELTHLDIGLLAHGLASLASRTYAQVAENQSLAERLAEIDLRLQSGEQAADVSRNLSQSLDHELSVVSTQLAEATGRTERAEGLLALASQEQKAVEYEGARLSLEITAIEQKLMSVSNEIAQLTEQMAALQLELTEVSATLTEREAYQVTVQAELAEANLQVESRKNQVIAILQSEAEKRNGVVAAQRNSEDAGRRLSRLASEQERAEHEVQGAQERAAAVTVAQTALTAERGQAVASVAAQRSERQQVEQRLQELQQQGATTREQIQGASSRLGAIEEMMNAFEGYQKGTRTVLMGREKAQPWASEVLGGIAELLRTEPVHEKAIEIALGGAIQNIITATDTGAKQAIEHLKRTGGGRATFMPLNAIRSNSFRPDEVREFTGAPGVVGVAVDLVRFDERYRPAISNLLGRVLIATNMDTALAFGKKTGMRYRIVTLDGELLSAGGALTGGSTGGQNAGLLSRERERDELTAKITSLKEALVATRQSFDQTAGQRAELDQQIKHQEEALRLIETRITQGEGELTRLVGEAKRWSDLLGTYATEADMLQEDGQQWQQTATRLQAELAALATERAALEAEVAQANLHGQARLAQLDEQAKELTGVQVRMAELGQQLRSVSGQCARLETESTTLHQDRTVKEAQQDSLAQRLEQAALDRLTARAEADEASIAKARFEEERAKLQTRKLEALEQTNNRERDMRVMRRAQNDAQTKHQQGEVEAARLRMEQDAMVTRLEEQHGLTAADIVGKELEESEVAGARNRLHLLREQIRELGPVNLKAIDEHQTAQERFRFLDQQRGDLDEAKSSLYRAVEELDKRIKTHFLDSFHVIRKEFQLVYTELFEGGKADLHLMDENDLLETGIEIVAQPPGKKPQTLSLLSGGERAMTACALLFALLRVKPTPFVVLDEVEAALDEANVERIGKYLKTFSGQGAQFICITHQRGTMEVADALYGVTMEGTGISRVVSVRLIDVEQEAS